MKKKKVALLHVFNPDKVLRGPDFFFALFQKEYQAYPKAKFDLYFVIKTTSKNQLIQLFQEWGIPIDKMIFLENHNNRLKPLLEWIDFTRVVLKHRFAVWLICTFRSPEEQMLQFKTLRKLTSWQGAKMIFAITYALLPQAFEERTKYGFYERDRWKYGALFSNIQFDAFFSWYHNFEDWARRSPFFVYQPLIQVLQSRFCNIDKFKPVAKKKWIVFASALESYKHPMTVVNAAIRLHADHPQLLKEWTFFIIGNGTMKDEIIAKIESHGLTEKVQVITGMRDISGIINQSMCFVSGQEEENFPSLAMNECMAAGNAIVARNVGRTHLFVQNEQNGFLVDAVGERAIEEGIQRFVLLPEDLQMAMGKHSRWLCEHVHTPENFILQTETLWNTVLNSAKN
jgi:glycosyltransferase involved in cell wall biosynthesis